jgi:hypothetical protein
MYEIHPLANKFPKIAKSSFRKLKLDLSKRGQQRPIALYESMVWDGRARLQACNELGLRPKVRILKSKDRPVIYLLKRHGRYGEPHSRERSVALDILWQIDQADWLAALKRRRTEWLRAARNEFRAIGPHKVQPCEVCGKYAEFAHAHHTLPLGVQFDLGIKYPIHDFNWLCPTHHKFVHMLISVYITDTRSGKFLDFIPDRAVDEWDAVERAFQKSFDLFEQYGGMNCNGHGYDYDYL